MLDNRATINVIIGVVCEEFNAFKEDILYSKITTGLHYKSKGIIYYFVSKILFLNVKDTIAQLHNIGFPTPTYSPVYKMIRSIENLKPDTGESRNLLDRIQIIEKNINQKIQERCKLQKENQNSLLS
ncbi:MAG TPA: hypothetical protein DCS17_04580 [Flavobacterium sp.]|nr:hypothetical protein [Flavobacterium sp.]